MELSDAHARDRRRPEAADKKDIKDPAQPEEKVRKDGRPRQGRDVAANTAGVKEVGKEGPAAPAHRPAAATVKISRMRA